ncbi:MAG: hypothetical protein RMK20_02285 [Verrucomicrobiales bacterium]|nr:hypothetical protein [Verrucomicrobiales bacterium]
MNTSIAVAIVALAGLIAGLPAFAQNAPMPKVGDKAPLITGKDQDGKTWKLEKRIGKKWLCFTSTRKTTRRDAPGRRAGFAIGWRN